VGEEKAEALQVFAIQASVDEPKQEQGTAQKKKKVDERASVAFNEIEKDI
jgi:hypothetical protein